CVTGSHSFASAKGDRDAGAFSERSEPGMLLHRGLVHPVTGVTLDSQAGCHIFNEGASVSDIDVYGTNVRGSRYRYMFLSNSKVRMISARTENSASEAARRRCIPVPWRTGESTRGQSVACVAVRLLRPMPLAPAS